MRRDSAIRSVAAMPECLLLILSCLIARPIRSQTLEYEQFIPPVVRFDRDQPVVLQVKVLGSVTRVVLEGVLSQPLEMRDDGSGGDQTAGDGIYTIQIQASQILSITKPDDFSRPFLGYATLYQGNTSIGRYNIFPEILTQNMPAVQVSALAQDVQSSPYVVNIHDPAYFTTFDHARITKRFYQFFPDDYDFINIIRLPSYFQNRHYMGVKNSHQGIGVTLFDGTSYYGSSGRLQGILVFPIPG